MRRFFIGMSAASGALLGTPAASAGAVDFSQFTAANSVPSDFSTPNWTTPTEYNGFNVNLGDVALETVNADTTLFYGPSTLDLTNKVITGDFYGASDDDYMGIALGVPTSGSGPFLNFQSDYLLLQWKGGTQSFDWQDEGDVDGNVANPFNNTTVGGLAPVGLSLNRVSGVPTADEFWQGADLTMYDPQGKSAPDPLTDPVLTDVNGDPFDSGGVQELARANTLGDKSYNRFGQRTRFEISYTPENITVLVDGVEEFNVNAPLDNLFPSGTLGLYEQAQGPSEAFAFFDVRDIGDAPATPGQDLSAPLPVATFAAANITASRNVDGAHDNDWIVEASTVDGDGNKLVEHASSNNKADATFSFAGQPVQDMRPSAVMMATIRQNGPVSEDLSDPLARSAYGGVEANSGFGGDDASGISTYGHDTGAEHNTNVAIAMFPYADGFRGGHVNPDGSLLVSNNNALYTTTGIEVPLPTVVDYELDLDGELPGDLFFAGNQQQVVNVAIAGENGQQDGLLFTVGSSAEDNWTAATPLADGSWNVAVRDADSVYYAAEDTFEEDDFSFLYLEEGDIENSVGGRVTGVDGAGNLSFAQTWGNFSMTREGVGEFSLSLPGIEDVGEKGMLLLNSTDAVTLSDGTVAPDSRWLTYAADGDTFSINLLDFTLSGDLTFVDQDEDSEGNTDGVIERVFTDNQVLTPTLADGGFSFAFVPFNPSDLMPSLAGDLNGDGFVGLDDLNIILGSWNASVAAGSQADPSGDAFVGLDDLNVVLGEWNQGTPPSAQEINASLAVPEPSTAGLLAIGALGLTRRRKSIR